MALKNTGINHGGTTAHPARDALRRFRDRGGRIVSFSPLRDDVDGDCEWQAPVPGTDVAIMLALAYVLATESLADRDFLGTYCTGYDRFERYLLGVDDGVPKSPQWASAICGLPAEDLVALARRMAAGRTIVTVSWSLQRIRHGEQAPWMGLTLAAMLGQIGLPGGGFGHGYGSMNEPGLPPLRCRLPTLPQGPNPVQTFIPVAAVSDMLLHPGEAFDYNGQRLDLPGHQAACTGPAAIRSTTTRTFPGCGGRWAASTPSWCTTRTGRRWPSTPTSWCRRPPRSSATTTPVPATTRCWWRCRRWPSPTRNPATTTPHSPRWPSGSGSASSSPRDAPPGSGWSTCTRSGPPDWISTVPPFDEFWRRGRLRLPTEDGLTLLADFRADPTDPPAGHPERAHRDLLGRHRRLRLRRLRRPPDVVRARGMARRRRGRRRFPLHLIANQPATRLHSQLDGGAVSQASKVQGREPIRMHPADAAARGLADGDVVRVFNDRGACLAGVVVDERVRPEVVQLSTGAWFDPADPADPDAMCVHGNPNVLTADVGTSSLAHGCTGAHVLVQVEKFTGPLPPVRAHEPPVIAPHFVP